jgi:predicted AlkP superfamily pyrophosphatase or phosphodiesterase
MEVEVVMRVPRTSALRWTVAATAVSMGLLAVSPPVQGATEPAAQVASEHGAAPVRPTRVVFIVLDQLRPEFIDAFDMENVQALIEGGASFPNAYLGHMASETVVSHNVMTSGMLPKHMGWSDEWFRDVDGVLGPEDARYVTGSMTQPQFDALIQDKGYPKLADYLHSAFPGRTVATVGEKNYAVYSMGGPGADIRLTFGSRSYDCDGDTAEDLTWRGPTGVNVPEYISAATCNRYYVDADKALNYDTLTTSPAWAYPLEGNRDIPGNDPAHRGGDVWVTDAAFAIMDHEPDWSGMLLTYGGIDKAGHMWGGLNDRPPYPGGSDPSSHMAQVAAVADEQVGRVIDRLTTEGLLDETLVVLTTDHGQLTAKHYFGVDGPLRGNLNWYYGADADESYLDPQPEIQRLIDETDDNVEMSMQDSAIRTWLIDRSRGAKKQAADVMATLGGVRASYYRVGRHYVPRWRAPRKAFSASEWRWFRAHAQEIVDTEAAPYGPDVVGLLANRTSYGVAGDHGGAQESVQRIPVVFYGAGVRPGAAPRAAIRSVDLLPTILRDLGIRRTHWMDGRSYAIPGTPS